MGGPAQGVIEEVERMLAQIESPDTKVSDKLQILGALHSMAETGPDFCEPFTLQLSAAHSAREDLFLSLLALVRKPATDPQVVEQLLAILVAVVRQVGLGIVHLRCMLRMLLKDGKWSHTAVPILNCMIAMAAPQGSDKERITQRTDRTPSPAPGLSFFVLDGVGSGIYLGGDNVWAWDTGYSFDSWVWWDKKGQKVDAALFKMVSGEDHAGRSQEVAGVVLRGQNIVVSIGDGSRKKEVTSNLQVPACAWTHIAVSHMHHKLKTSVVQIWVNGRSQTLNLKYPSEQEGVRVYACCSGWRPHNGNEILFQGLVKSFRVWDEGMSESNAEKARLGMEVKRPRLCAEPGSASFLHSSEEELASPPHRNLCMLPLGSLRSCGGLTFHEALSCCGELYLLLWLLSTSLQLSKDQSEAQATAHCVIVLISEVVKEKKWVDRWRVGVRAQTLIGGLTQALESMPAEFKHPDILESICSIIDVFAEGSPKAATNALEIHQHMVWHWLLNSKAWKGCREDVMKTLLDYLQLATLQRPEAMYRVCDPAVMLESLLSMLRASTRSTLSGDDLLQSASEDALDSTENRIKAVKSHLVDSCWELLLAAMKDSKGAPKSAETLRKYLHASNSGQERRAALELVDRWCANVTSSRALNKNEMQNCLTMDWANTFLSLVRESRTENLGIVLQGLSHFLVAARPNVLQQFEDCGGFTLVTDVLCARDLSIKQQSECYLALKDLLLGGVQTNSAESKVRNVCALTPLLHFLEVCEVSVRRQAIVDMVNLLQLSDQSRQSLVSATGWADKLLCLAFGIGGEQANPYSIQSRKKASLPSVVSWCPNGRFMDPERASVSSACVGARDGMLFDEVCSLLRSIVVKSQVAEDGWKVLRDVLAAFCHFRPAPQQIAAESLEEILVSKAREVISAAQQGCSEAVSRTEKWDGKVLEGTWSNARWFEVSVLRENIGGLLSCTHTYLHSSLTEEKRFDKLREFNDDSLDNVTDRFKRVSNGVWADESLVSFSVELVKALFNLKGAPRGEELNLSALWAPRSADNSFGNQPCPCWWSRSICYLALFMLTEYQTTKGEHAEGVKSCCQVLTDVVIWSKSDSGIDARVTYTVSLVEQYRKAAKERSDPDMELFLARTISQLARHVDQKELYMLSQCKLFIRPVKASTDQVDEDPKSETGMEVLHKPLDKSIASIVGEHEWEIEGQESAGETATKTPSADEDASQKRQGGVDLGTVTTAVDALEALAAFDWSASHVAAHCRWARITMVKEVKSVLSAWIDLLDTQEREWSSQNEKVSAAVHVLSSSCAQQRANDIMSEAMRKKATEKRQEIIKVVANDSARQISSSLDQVLAEIPKGTFCLFPDPLSVPAKHWRLDPFEGHARIRPRLKENKEYKKHQAKAGSTIPDEDSEGNPVRLVGVKPKKVDSHNFATKEVGEEEKDVRDDASDTSFCSVGSDELDVDAQVQGAVSNVLLHNDSLEGVDIDMNAVHSQEATKSPIFNALGFGGQKETTQYQCECELVTPAAVIVGWLEITDRFINFVPQKEQTAKTSRDVEDQVKKLSARTHSWELENLVEIHGRTYLLCQTAIELFFIRAPPTFLNFPSDPGAISAVEKVFNTLASLRNTALLTRKKGLRRQYLRDSISALQNSKVQEDWLNRRISNFDYLMHLNTFAGRTYNDLTQYPVFPWILKDYSSEYIDLANPEIYRDLSMPIGVQTEAKVAKFRERFENWIDDEIPAFHFGTHYSTPGYVLWYLLRLEPYTSMAVHLQGGKFDCPDRMFWSVGDTFKNCTTTMNDVKELIPEFFYLPNFLVNEENQEFGVTQDRGRVGDVELPPWANGSAYEFVRLNRQALESEYVSANLHHWIDLIFGCKQQGEAAVEATNVFYYMTYQDAVDINAIEDPAERKSVEAQIADYGQTPKQLFFQPHPKRKPLDQVPKPVFYNQLLFSTDFSAASRRDPMLQAGETEFGELGAYVVSDRSESGAGSVYIRWLSDCVVDVNSEGDIRVWCWDGKAPVDGLPFTLKVKEASLRSRLTKGKTTFEIAKGVAKGFKGMLSTGSVQVDRDMSIGPESRCAGSGWWNLFLVIERKQSKVVLCGGHPDGSVSVYSVEDGLPSLAQKQSMHQSMVTCMAVSNASHWKPGGPRLFTGSRDGTIRVWSLGVTTASNLTSGGKVLKKPLPATSDFTLCGHNDEVTCLAISDSKEVVVSGSADGTCCVYTMRRNSCLLLRTIPHPARARIDLLCLSDHSGIIMYSSEEDCIHTFDVNGHPVASVASPDDPLSYMMLSDDGMLLFTGTTTGQVIVRCALSLAICHRYVAAQGFKVQIMALSPCKNFVLAGYSDGRMEVLTNKESLLGQSQARLAELGLDIML